LFAATLLLWIFTALMWWVTRKVALEGRDGIKAAQRSAKAAEKVLTHTKKTSRSELRAYIGIDLSDENTSRIDVSSGERSISAEVLIKNFGRTPAFQLQVSSKIEIREHPLVGVLAKEIRPTTQSTVTLNPDQTISVTERTKDIRSPPPVINEINKETKAIYFSGRINFIDIFNKKRWVDFAMYSHTGGDGNADFWLCDFGNRTSEEAEED
jgi:hypothetical protein